MTVEAVQKLVPLPGPLDKAISPRVVILGAGFASLNCAKKFRRSSVDVTIVDSNNCNAFQPLLYQVALAALSPFQIAAPVRSVPKGAASTPVLMDEVVRIDVNQRKSR